MNKLGSMLLWAAVAIVGAISFAALGARARRERERGLAGDGGAQRLLHRLPVLQQVHRRPGAAARRRAAHAGGAAQRRHGLRADQQVGALRPPLRGDRRRGPAGRAGARGADGLPAGHVVDPGRRRHGRRGAGLHRAVRVDAARRQVARRDDQDGARPDPRLARAGGRAGDHDHHPGGAERWWWSRRLPRARGACSRSRPRFRSRCSWASTCGSSAPGASARPRPSAWCCCWRRSSSVASSPRTRPGARCSR